MGAQVDVECYRGPGDRPAPTVRDAMIKTAAQAQVIGKAIIDEDWWVTRAIQLQHAYTDGITGPWQIVTLDAGELGAEALPGTVVVIESMSDKLDLAPNRSVNYRATTEVHHYSAPAVGFGS